MLEPEEEDPEEEEEEPARTIISSNSETVSMNAMVGPATSCEVALSRTLLIKG